MSITIKESTSELSFLLEELKKEAPGTAALSADLSLVQEGTGYAITFATRNETNEPAKINIKIAYERPADRNRALFQAVAIALDAQKNGKDLPTETITGESPFTDFGIMLDLARDGAMKESALKQMIRSAAFMGYTYVGMYVEDVLKVEGEPYFGYMRGAYSKEEIHALDSYAKQFGVELRPYIQTLAHLNQIIRYKDYRDAIDTDSILLVGADRTRELMEHLIKTVAESFSSRTVNIGMDEAHMVGLGRYLDLHGYQDRAGIILQQLDLVLKLCRQYGLHAQMWSDMFFRLAAHGQYDVTDISQLKSVKIPDDLTLVYWDYYSLEAAHYADRLKKHKAMTDKIAFAGGAWKWSGFVPRNAFAIAQGKASLPVCRNEKIKDVVITAWGDDGAEAGAFSVLPVYWSDAAVAYGQDYEAGFRLMTGLTLAQFIQLDTANPYSVDGITYSNCSKFLLYNDPLQGAFDSLVRDDTAKRFAKVCEDLKELTQTAEEADSRYTYLFKTLAALTDVLALKADLGVRLHKAYDLATGKTGAGTAGNEQSTQASEASETGRKQLSELAQVTIPELIHRLEQFYEAFRAQWRQENKTFGFEVHDIRLGGFLMRLKDVQNDLRQYLDGETSGIDELEEKQLPFGCSYDEGEPSLERENYNVWELIAATGRLGF